MRLSKAQRRRLITSSLREEIISLDGDALLAVHDLIHEIMGERYGSTRRADAAKRPDDGAPGRGCKK